ncbi:hypothetical protein ACFE04_025231 [Oxalis oulophora]
MGKNRNRNRKSNACIDRISQLPDDVLAKIISFLTRKQAATTSSLSTRWKDVWKLYSGFFEFDDGSATRYRHREPTRMDGFINWVNQLLQSHEKAATMKRLRVDLNLRSSFHQFMDKLIHHSSLKCLQFLDLNLSFYNNSHLRPNPSSSLYALPSGSPFRSLKTLSLKHVQISRETLESLLTHCIDLEELTVTHSYALQSFKLYSLSLKQLTLWFCGDSNKLVVRSICAPNLLSFTYALHNSHRVNLLLEKDVPQLKYLNTGCHRCHFRGHLLQLDELVLHRLTCSYCASAQMVHELELPYLKSLTIKEFESITDDDFSRFIALLKAAPLLENLTFEDNCIKLDEAEWNITEDHHYNNLKKVKFIGCSSRRCIKPIRHFISHAPLLETIIVDACSPLELGTPDEVTYRQSDTYLGDRGYMIRNVASEFPNIVTVV